VVPPVVIVGKVNATGGAVTNSASVAPAAGGIADPDLNNNTATVSTDVLPGADVRIAQKTVISALPATAGQPVSFKIQPRNDGPASALNAVVTDPLPAGWVFVSAAGPNWTCTNVAQTVRCSRAVFPTSATDDIVVVATAPDSAAVGATGKNYTNIASIASDTADPSTLNNSGSVNVLVRPDGADLRLSKTKTPNPVALDSKMVSTIVVTNGGPRVATGPLRVVESLIGEEYVDFSGDGWACTPSGTVVVCEHPNANPGLAVNASLPTLFITTKAKVAGAVSNQACTGNSLPAVAGGAVAKPPLEGDPNPTNDCVTATARSTTVQPDLAITKATLTPTGGDHVVSTSESSVTYRLVVTNATTLGSDAATGVRITDTVPGFYVPPPGSTAPSTTFGAITSSVSGGTAVFACTSAGATVTCNQTGGALAPAEMVTVDITVNRPLQAGDFTNTATVTNTVEGDPNPNNYSASAPVKIEPIADVMMTGKSVNPSTVRAGVNASYVLSYVNNGPSPALGVKVSDAFTFPAGDTGVTVVSISATKAGASCSIGAGAQLTPATPSFSCDLGTLANDEVGSVTLVVRPNWKEGNAQRVLPNTANITTTSVENPDGTDNDNNSKTATLTIDPASLDLQVAKDDDPVFDPLGYTAGSTFMDFAVTVQNNGPSYGTGVKFTESMLPPLGKSARFVCDTDALHSGKCNVPSLCTVTNALSPSAGAAIPTFSCDVPAGNLTTGLGRGELANGQQKFVYLRFEVPDQPEPTGDVFKNTVVASANEPDTNLANNTAAATTTTRQRIDLRASKFSSASPVSINQPFVWTIAVENCGPGKSLVTDVVDVLPAGAELTGAVSYTSVPPAGWVSRCSAPSTPYLAAGTTQASGHTLTMHLGQVDASRVAFVTVPVRFTAYPGGTGQVTNVATVDTDPAKTGGIDTPGNNNVGTSPVQVTQATLSGTVFEDRDRSGSNGGVPQDATQEPRIAGVAIRLTGKDAWGNTIDRTVTTGADGSYSFASLPKSDDAGYTVTETQPAGYLNSPVSTPSAGANAPTAGGTYSAGGTAGNSGYATVVLGAATTATAYNFPEVRKPSLSGFVYVDNNFNGVRDAGTDSPIVGATVRLLNATTGDVVATAITDDKGAYKFASLDPLISYTLEEPLPTTPANLANGAVNAGLVGSSACAGCAAAPNGGGVGVDRITNIDLSSGADGTAFNFGERLQTFIAGLVYIDANRNNGLDASDTGRLAGVTLRLVQGADCSSGTTLQTVTSGADGSYRFDNVIAGQDYLVCETQPTGYGTGNAKGTPGSNVISIIGLPASGSTGNHFGETLASLSGTVYQDNGTGVPALANNGVKDAGEVGIANVPVTLTGTDVLGNPVSRTTTTDANGNWSFDGLLPANGTGYTVTEGVIPPASGNFVDGRETVGNAGGSSTVNDQFSGITLAPGQQGSGYLFGELGIAPISGTVYIDINHNGNLDPTPTDGRIPGVTLTLVLGPNCSGTVVATTQTDASGNYSFSGAAAGLTYTICETQPAGYLHGGENPGAGNTSVTNAITITNLAVAGSTGNHFGELASNSAITGRVWLDANNSGVIDATETGLAGITIELTGTDLGGTAVTRTTTTDATGNYSFTGLAPGNYTVREPAQPAGTLNGTTVPGSTGGTASTVATTPSTLSNIALGLSQTSSGNNFGEIPPAQIAGRVYADNNNNGVIDGTEAGLGGVTLVLTGTDDTGAAVSVTVTTATDGSYVFPNLRPGSYTVTEPSQPAGTVNGITTPGSSGGTATAPTVVPSAIAAIVLTPGAQSTGNNFGELAQSPDLRVSKQHSPSTFTLNNRGTYTVTVRNVGELPTAGVYTVTDKLPIGLTLAAQPTGTGWVCGGGVGDSSFSCTSSSVVNAGATSANTITVVVGVGALAPANSPLNNVVMVEGGGEIDARRPSDAERNLFNGNPAGLPVCDAAISTNVCRDPTPVQLAAAVSGTVWSDIGTATRLLDAGDKRLAGWLVEVVNPATGEVVARATTGADGSYRVGDLVPGVELAIRFRDPASGVVFGYPVNGQTAPGSSGAGCDTANALSKGTASSCVGSGASPALKVVLAPGQELPQQSLPVDPSGVVYDSGTRQPVPGSVVSLSPIGTCAGWNPATQLVGASLGGYAIQGSTASMTVGADGFYQYLFAPNAPASCLFAITVTPPQGYSAPSKAIPPTAGVLAPAGGGNAVFAAQPQAAAPTAAPGTATQYWLQITGGSGVANIVHNHLPLDPALPGGISLSKTGDKAVAEVGDTVRYTITVQVTSGALPRQTTVVDRLPAGFTFVPGTAMVDGVTIANPQGGVGPVLAFNLGAMPAGGRQVLQYRVRVGVGAAQGDGINHAKAHACSVPAGCVGSDGRTPLAGSVATNHGQYQVRVSGGVFAPEACVLGKVFVDCNHNHVQDDEELGVPGVRLVLSDGTTLISDVEGKYSICGLPPKSHVLRVDPHTLPRGSRLTTSSNRNLGDAGSLWLDLKNGELHRADFVEGSCSNTVLDQVKARRAQGEVRAPETERAGQPALRFDSKAHGKDALSTPQQGTDGANQLAPKVRDTQGPAAQGAAPADEQNQPTPTLPMNRPPPPGRDTGTAPDAAPGNANPQGAGHGAR
jgi:uncharacterized repeat protein (TIGR01451 family)